MIMSDFKLTEQDRVNFKQKGFIKLKNFFAPSSIECLNQILEQELEDSDSIYAKGVNRFKYDFESNDDLEIIAHPLFQSTLTQLCQKSLFYTQHLGFELKKNAGKGLPWHIGNVSFVYQHLEDFGCTLWIPLSRIDTNGQGGGMSYVSTDILSGKFLYQYSNMLSSYVQDLQKKNKPPLPEEMNHLDYFIPNSPEVDPMLNKFAESDNFEVGDALLFHKDVIHRSCPLTEGPLETRKAFVMRFIDVNSTYDLDRVQRLKPFQEIVNYGSASTFGEKVCQQEGEIIIDSPLFKDTKEKRLLPFERV